MGTLINPPVQVALGHGCKASRDAVALGPGSMAVGLVGSLEAHSCTWASIGLAAGAKVWLLAEELVRGFSEVFNPLEMETVQRMVRFRGASAALISRS